MEMPSSFNLQEYPLPILILQQILAKMEGKALVKLCLTSRIGRDLVEKLQGARLQRYLAAKRIQDEFLKVSKIPEIPSRPSLQSYVFIIKHHLDRNIGYLEQHSRNHFVDTDPHVVRDRKLLELAQKLEDNWEILH